MGDGSSWRRWRRIFRPDPGREVEDELAFHLEERIRDYIDRGMDPEVARRAALDRLGDIDRVRDECTGILAAERLNEERRVRLNVSWLDVKLGVRMLVKYPGLSLVSGVGMALAIAIGAGYFSAIGTMVNPMLPLEGGDRIVAIRIRDATRPGSSAQRASAQDFVYWRDELKSIRDLGAFRDDNRNLIAGDGITEPVRIAAMTASGFRLTRIPPMLGRPLIAEDEREGATPVVVIAYDEWQPRFDGDPDILGTTVRIGGTVHTVVGVMPDGFGFPINHRYWVPLQLNASDYGRGIGPSITVFGRLADGYTLAQARAELTTIGERMAAAFPDTHEHLRPTVLPYTHALIGIDTPAMALAIRAVQLALSLLLVIVCVNVAVLVYARTVPRTGEIAVRSALGASRRRVVTQLFVEALVLSSAAAAVGLTIAGIGLGIADDFQKLAPERPFWIEFGLSLSTIVYVAFLAIIAGGIVGVLPALKATGKHVLSGLEQLSTRGSARQLGRTWTAFIVVQVAIAVAAMPAAVNFAEQSLRLGTGDPAPVANDLLRATVDMVGEETPAAAVDSVAYERAFRARYADRTAELVRRLEVEPAVSGVTFASHFPGTDPYARIEVEGHAAPAEENASSPALPPRPMLRSVRTNRVDMDLFRAFDVPVLAGRGFVAGDTREGATAVIVSKSFAERIAGGANVLGHRVRYARRSDDDTDAAQWYEIVGIVPDFTEDFTKPNSFDGELPRIYHAAPAGQTYPAVLVVRIRDGSAAGFAPRLRDVAAAVDPTLTFEQLETVVAAWGRTQQAMWYTGLGISAVMLSVLLLSAAGIYAMMSFSVARRRREIGIRSALGADPRRILSGIFGRASAQLGTGVLAGLIVAAALDRAAGGGITGDRAVILLPIVAALMVTVGLLAALGPARRGLAIQPTEALRDE